MKNLNALRVAYEIEVKLQVQDVRRIRQKIRNMGFLEEIPRSMERSWILDFPDLNLRRSGQLLRLREYHSQRLVTFKGPALKSRLYKVREELETEVADVKTVLKIMGKLGLKTRFRCEKYRTSFKSLPPNTKAPVVITLDETPMGNYLEIEGRPEVIREVANQLGFSPNHYLRKGYTELFFASKLAKNQKNMVFKRK